MKDLNSKCCSDKKVPLLFAIGVFLALAVIGGYLAIFEKQKDDRLSLIDNILILYDQELDNTEDIETDFEELPTDLLDVQAISTTEIDTSISDIEEEINALDSLESDFDIEADDIGL